MDSTQQTTRHAAPAPLCWTLTIAHHTDAACIGRRLVLEGAKVMLGRELAMLGEDRRLSRVHATIQVVDDGLQVRDEGSRNGTFVDGVRISEATLHEGSLLGVGGIVLLVRKQRPLVDALPQHPRIAFASLSMADVLADLERAAAQRGPVLLLGETGVGKGLLAEELHLMRARNGPFVAVHCGSIGEAGLHAQLFGEGDRAGLLESAEGGTLFLDGADDAHPALQTALLSALDGGDIRRVGEARSRRVDLSIVASARTWPASLRADFATRLGGWTITVPPLRDRREDVGAIAARFLAQTDGAPTLHHELALELIRHDWPGNVRELQAALTRAALEREEAGELRATEKTAAIVSSPREEPIAIESGHAIARSGAFFDVPGRGRVSLESRKVLQLLLQALAEKAGAPLTVAELLAAGWPTERVLPRAGASRVYVSIASLRKMGAPLERTTHGYRVQDGVRII